MGGISLNSGNTNTSYNCFESPASQTSPDPPSSPHREDSQTSSQIKTPSKAYKEKPVSQPVTQGPTAFGLH